MNLETGILEGSALLLWSTVSFITVDRVKAQAMKYYEGVNDGLKARFGKPGYMECLGNSFIAVPAALFESYFSEVFDRPLLERLPVVKKYRLLSEKFPQDWD